MKNTIMLLALCCLAMAGPARAERVTATLTAGTNPRAVAINPVTNKIYVANYGGTTVTVIDGATNATATVTVGSSPVAVAVNPATNKIYVANRNSATVTVINGADNTTAAVTVGGTPNAVAVNPVTNKIYVPNYGSNSVTVIDGATNGTTTVAVGTNPSRVAVNPVTNKIYVANRNSNNVTVINGADNTTATVSVGSGPQSVSVNPATNKIYVANYGGTTVTVINGADNTTAAVAVGSNPLWLAVNPATNKIYVPNYGSATVTVIDGATNGTTNLPVGTNPYTVAVNPVTNKSYMTNYGSANVTVIDGADNTTATVAASTHPCAVSVNPVTGKIYVVNETDNNVTVIDGADNTTATVTVGSYPCNVAVNPVTNKSYMTNYGSATVTVIDGADNTTAAVTVGSTPNAVAVNPVTNKIYVTNGNSDNVTVINGADNSKTNVTVGDLPNAVAVNPVTNKIYVANLNSHNVTVIDGADNTTATVSAEYQPRAVAVNPVTNKIYIANYGSGTVTVINGADNTTAAVSSGNQPRAVAVNPATNRIYVANASSPYVTVINGANNSTVTVAAGTQPWAVAVNPLTNKVYVANMGSDNVTIIDGATNTTATVTVGDAPQSVAVNPVTNKAYVPNPVSNNVTVIDEVLEWDTGIQAALDPLPGHACYSKQPDLYGTATVGWSPQATGISLVLDRWTTGQAGWNQATVAIPDTSTTGWQYGWGTDSLLWGENYINIVPLESQCATTNNLGEGTPMAGNMLTYPIYYLDSIGPTTVSLASPADGTIARDSVFTFAWNAAADNYGMGYYRFQYARDEGFSLGLFETTTYGTSLVRKLPTSDTLYYWRVRAIDAAGNNGGWSPVWSVEMDLAPPTTPGLTAPGDQDWSRDTSVAFAWTAVGKWAKGSAVRYVKQVDTVGTFNSDFLKTDTTASTGDSLAFPEGKYYWRVMAFDLAGNTGSYSASRWFGIDTTMPGSFDLASPPHLDMVKPKPLLIWHPSGDSLSGIQTYEVYIGGELRHSGSDTSWTSDSLADGIYSWYVEALDMADNARASAQTWNFTVDHALAVHLSMLEACGLAGGGMVVRWRTESENGCYQWRIERSPEPVCGYQQVGEIPGHGSSSQGHDYQFVDEACEWSEGGYYYRLAEVDIQGAVTYYGPVRGVIERPNGYALQPCRPNPVRSSAYIAYQLPKASNVTLEIYSITGQLVKRFDEGTKQPGYYSVKWNAAGHGAGVYFYRLRARLCQGSDGQAGEYQSTKKLVVIK